MFPSFGRKSMEKLEDSVGEKAEIDFVARKVPLSVLGEIKGVKRFRFIEIKDIALLSPLDLNLAPIVRKKCLRIPFVWPGAAIQKIEAEEILYDNFWINDDYNQLDPNKVFELAEILFGKEAAQEFIELKQIIEEKDANIFKIFYT